MRKITFLLAMLVAFSFTALSQSGWNQVDSDLSNGVGIGQISLGMNDATAMWCLPVNGDGSIFDGFTRSTDGGETWQAGTFNAGDGLSQLFAIDALTCWAIFNTGADQGLYLTVDGGAMWVKQGGVYGSSSFANVVHFFDDMNGFAQGDPVDGYYELYTTTDGGTNWTRVPEANIPAPTSGEYGITGNYCASGDNIWFGTNQGRIYYSNDMGYTWNVTLTAFGADETVAPLMFDDMNGIVYRSYLDLGIETVLNETNDGGATWTEFTTSGPSFARYFAHVQGTTNTLIGSASSDTEMGIARSEDGGHTWTEITVQYPFQASAWLDLETGWSGTYTVSGNGGMYIYGNPPAPTNLQANVDIIQVDLTWDAPSTPGPTSFSDDFEAHEDFVINFPPWVNLDVDGSTTYGMTDIDWTNAYVEQSFIIFNPSQTTPAVEDIIPHSGDKIAACFAATAPPNNDWMIAPQITIESGAVVSFWAKSYTADYGLERFKVGVSTTGLDPADFTIITPGDYVEAPVDDWTEFTYTLDDFVGQNVYVGIQCVSNDAFILLIDDFYAGTGKSSFAFNPPSPVVGRGTKVIGKSTSPAKPHIVNIPKSPDVLEGYNVYRNDVMINTSTVMDEFYTDMDLPIGTFDYYVTAVYSGGESDPSNVVTVVVTDIDELDEYDVEVYPNPARDFLNIKAENITSIRIFNTIGQLVYSQEMGVNHAQINVNDLQTGVYFVQIDTEKGSVTQKIMVE